MAEIAASTARSSSRPSPRRDDDLMEPISVARS